MSDNIGIGLIDDVSICTIAQDNIYPHQTLKTANSKIVIKMISNNLGYSIRSLTFPIIVDN